MMTDDPFKPLSDWKKQVDAEIAADKVDEAADDARADQQAAEIRDLKLKLNDALTLLYEHVGKHPPTDPTDPTDPEVPTDPPPPAVGDFFLWSEAEIKSAPKTYVDAKGETKVHPGWTSLGGFAHMTWTPAALNDLNAQGDTQVVAGALYYVHTGDLAMKAKVEKQLMTLLQTRLYRTLEAARGLQGYILAADLIGFKDPAFWAYVEQLITFPLAENSHSGFRTLELLAKHLWNNWSMHGRAAVLLAGLGLVKYGNASQKVKGQGWIDLVHKAHRQLLGLPVTDPFKITFPDDPVEWLQGDPIAAVVVKGTTVQKFGKTINLSGVLPLDRLRGSYDIQWPPVKTGYNAEGAQGLVTVAALLHRAGLLSFTAADNAMVRVAYAQYGMGEAATNDPIHYEPFIGDDGWLPYYINHFAGLTGSARVPEAADTTPGKGGVGHGLWLYGSL